MTSNRPLDERLDRARGADFRLWVEALLDLVPAQDPRVRRLRGIPRLAIAPAVTASCRIADGPPIQTEMADRPTGVMALGSTRVPDPPDNEQVHVEFAAAVRTRNLRTTAKAWMVLRAVDPDGVTLDERQAGTAATRAWGAVLTARES